MFRYLSVMWNPADTGQQAAAKRLVEKCRAEPSGAWATPFECAGVVVMSTVAAVGAGPRLLSRSCGVVLGHLFRSGRTSESCGDDLCESLDDCESERIIRSGGRELIIRYWGNYVAILNEPTRSVRWVLRAPMATLPCLHTCVHGVDLYCSLMEDCARLGEASFSINWAHVARTLVGPLLSTQTSLREVRELLPGTCDEIRARDRLHHRYWNPIEIANDTRIDSFEDAKRAVHAVTTACVRSWSRGQRRILHCLSGGLDSSILLGCLSGLPAPPEIVCFTHFAPGTDADEREFARIAVRRAGCRHIEWRRDSGMDLRSLLHHVRLPASAGLRLPAVDRIEPDAACDVAATAIFKGHGGDELFCRHHTRYYVADYLRAHGFGRQLLALLVHSAFVEGETAWKVLGGALANAFIPRRWDLTSIFHRDQQNQSLLHSDVLRALQSDQSFDLPFARSTRECTPGKLWQIAALTTPRPYYNPWDRAGDPERIAPLLSQPVVETCLRIPTYLQMQGRWDRAVARAAFVRELPPEIAERRSKGGAEQLAWRTLLANLDIAREILLDGLLVRERFIDRPRLEAALSTSPGSDIRGTVPIFDLLGTEAWLRAWRNPQTAQ